MVKLYAHAIVHAIFYACNLFMLGDYQSMYVSDDFIVRFIHLQLFTCGINLNQSHACEIVGKFLHR
jgi:hypothetical protein